jgi:hypothetical protein
LSDSPQAEDHGVLLANGVHHDDVLFIGAACTRLQRLDAVMSQAALNEVGQDAFAGADAEIRYSGRESLKIEMWGTITKFSFD